MMKVLNFKKSLRYEARFLYLRDDISLKPRFLLSKRVSDLNPPVVISGTSGQDIAELLEQETGTGVAPDCEAARFRPKRESESVGSRQKLIFAKTARCAVRDRRRAEFLEHELGQILSQRQQFRIADFQSENESGLCDGQLRFGCSRRGWRAIECRFSGFCGAGMGIVRRVQRFLTALRFL